MKKTLINIIEIVVVVSWVVGSGYVISVTR
jgi:hypothetical protein